MKTNQTLANECLALACFCSYTFDGDVISGAFDFYGDYLDSTGTSKTYNFSIGIKDGMLTLSVDAYTVANEFTEFTPETWDVDAWEDQRIVIDEVPANRANFYELARCARALINGRSVTFANGTVIQPIARVGSMKTFSVRITLADGTVHLKTVTATSAVDLFDQMQAIAKEYPTYVSSEGSLVKESP